MKRRFHNLGVFNGEAINLPDAAEIHYVGPYQGDSPGTRRVGPPPATTIIYSTPVGD